ncbi:MAG: protein-disulfide reductase DsbD family protein, partial [Candidatus Thiodiazotropha sp.]
NQSLRTYSWLFILVIFLFTQPFISAFASEPFGDSNEEEEFLTVGEAFQLTATAPSASQIKLFWNIADGYYLYRKRISVSTDDTGVTLGSIALARCARARAWLDGEEFVAPHHIQAVAPAILRHRILLTFEAEAEGITTDDFLSRLLDMVAIP